MTTQRMIEFETVADTGAARVSEALRRRVMCEAVASFSFDL